MGFRLVNVRLDPQRLRKVQTLRERGIALADVLREAVDERFAELRRIELQDVGGIVARILERYPDPPGLPPRAYDVHDRRAARLATLRRLRRART